MAEHKKFYHKPVHSESEGVLNVVMECRHPMCGKPFRPTVHNKVFCSEECKEEYYSVARAMGVAGLEILRKRRRKDGD